LRTKSILRKKVAPDRANASGLFCRSDAQAWLAGELGVGKFPLHLLEHAFSLYIDCLGLNKVKNAFQYVEEVAQTQFAGQPAIKRPGSCEKGGITPPASLYCSVSHVGKSGRESFELGVRATTVAAQTATSREEGSTPSSAPKRLQHCRDAFPKRTKPRVSRVLDATSGAGDRCNHAVAQPQALCSYSASSQICQSTRVSFVLLRTRCLHILCSHESSDALCIPLQAVSERALYMPKVTARATGSSSNTTSSSTTSRTDRLRKS